MKLPEKLQKQMTLRSINARQLAMLSGVSDSEISRILTGKSTPGLENAFKLGKALGVSLDYLADDALESDRQEGVNDPAEREVVALARDLGVKAARRVLETTIDLGFDLAIRRLLGVDRN